MATAFPAKEPCGICSIPVPRFHWRKPGAIAAHPCAPRTGLADSPRLAAREHDFLTGISPIALCKRGMLPSTPDFLGIQARRGRLRQEWARPFVSIEVVFWPPAPLDPSGNDPKSPIRAIARRQKMPYFGLMLGLSRRWRRFPGRRGSGDTWDGLPRGVLVVAAGVHRWVRFKRMAARPTSGAIAACFVQVRPVSVSGHGWNPQRSR